MPRTMKESETLLEWVRKNRKSDLKIRSDAKENYKEAWKVKLKKKAQQ
jgi:hypothetical protein